MHSTLLLLGKRPGQPLMVTDVAGLPTSRLFYILDHSTGLRFLVDTGAEVSVIPPSHADGKHQQTSIKTFGNRSLTLDLGLRRSFRWVFTIADVKHPIFGADFLRSYNLLVDMRRNRLTDSLTQIQVQDILSTKPSPSPTLLPWQHTNEYEAILSDIPAVTQPSCGEQPVSTALPTTSLLRALLSARVPDDSLQNDSKLLVKSLSTCCNSGLSALHPVAGHHLCTWYPKRHQVTGVLAEITGHLIT